MPPNMALLKLSLNAVQSPTEVNKSSVRTFKQHTYLEMNTRNRKLDYTGLESKSQITVVLIMFVNNSFTNIYKTNPKDVKENLIDL